MARRGRPRKAGRRYPNGRLIAVRTDDPGTPQLKAKRRRLVGAGGDPVLATSPVDIMFARQLVDQETVVAAEWFRNTARVFLGAPHRRNLLDRSGALSEPPESAQRWAETRYFFLAETIDAGRRAELLNLVHFTIVPPWLVHLVNGQPLSSRDHQDRARQMAALRDLVKVYVAWTRAGPKVAVG